MQHDIEQELLELDDFCPDAAASFPPAIGVKTRVALGSNRDTCRMAFHDSVEHSPQSSRVVPSGHEHNGLEPMLVAPWRKHLGFTFGSNVGSGDLHDIRHAKPPQLANLPCTRILVREPPADELVVFSTRRVGKNRNSRRDAALHEIRCFERPAPPEPSDTTMMSAGATGSLTTSAHPAARRTGSRTEGTATKVAATNATTTRIGAHLGRRELMLRTSRVARQWRVP